MLSKKYIIAFIIIILLPIVVTLAIYPSLPDTVPTNFNGKNVADAFGSKSLVWIPTMVYAFMNICMLGGLYFSLKLSKKPINPVEFKYNAKIFLILGVSLDLISLELLYATAKYDENNPHNIMLITLLLAFIVVIFLIIESIKLSKEKKRLGIK